MFKHNSTEFKVWLLIAVVMTPIVIYLDVRIWLADRHREMPSGQTHLAQDEARSARMSRLAKRHLFLVHQETLRMQQVLTAAKAEGKR